MKVLSTIISASLLIGSVAGIFGGKPASPESAYTNRTLQQKRYMAGIRKAIGPNFEDDFSFCEGNANYVSVGAIYNSGGEDGDEIEVVKITKHSHFNKETLSNNFAVLKLKKKVRDDIKPVKLPTRTGSKIRTGKMATAMGWGLISAKEGSDVLLTLDQKLISNEECRTKFDSTTIDMTLVCAGGKKDESPCAGDIGGPLVYENSNGDGDDILIGLFGGGTDIGCGIEGYPAIYSRVSSALDWIITAMMA